jgi:anti-anti-sigma regulatory factor
MVAMLFEISTESNPHSTTVYVVGMLGETAATRAETIVQSLSRGIQTIRVDLRGVVFIDPQAFVRLARALTRWRDIGGGRVTMQFPARSERRRDAKVSWRAVTPHRGITVVTAIN